MDPDVLWSPVGALMKRFNAEGAPLPLTSGGPGTRLIAEMPKAELYPHVDGSLRVTTALAADYIMLSEELVASGGPIGHPSWHRPTPSERIGAIPDQQSQGDIEMALTLGDTAPDFEAETTEGPIRFHDWIGDSWAILFSHPKDFTPVCTTELGYMAKIQPDFESRNVKVIGLSVDPMDNHEKWLADIEETQGARPNYPIIADPDFNVSKLYGMLPAETEGDPTARTPAQNQTVRNVFVVGPDKKIKLILVYPMTTGRNFDEVLRVIDSLQLTANHRVATPVNWQQGDDVIIAGSVSDDEAKEIYPDGWESPRPYIRIVPQPVGD
jgi:alkyl hydroperoxide reductase subunit AhpC